MKLVLASNNAKKLGELSEILGPAGWELIPQSRLGVDEADEPHLTFIENALAKARHAARVTGLPALADDSGLCVDALGGAPGVFSARYGGEPKSDARNNEKLLAELAKLAAHEPGVSRRARFVCVIVYVRSADDPQPLIAEGEWVGEILATASGSGGFGYDPLMWIAECKASVAELPAAEKHRRSHRGQALAKLVDRLRERG
jgi:XTP/dITP diphosphohydrolase